MDLQNTLISELVFDKTILISVSENDSLADVNDKLVQYNILSVPVFSPDKGQYLGLLDVFDLMGYVAFGKQFNSKKKEEHYTEHSVEFVAPEWRSTTAGELLRLTQQDTLKEGAVRDGHIYVYHPYESLTCLLKPFSNAKTHRVLVDVKGDLTQVFQHTYRLLSQTDLVRFFAKNISKGNQHILNSSVQGLGLLKGGTVHTIGTMETAMDGFQKLWVLRGCSALAVVDTQGKLVANLSASDLRGITEEKFVNLYRPVVDFLETMKDANRPAKLVVCSPSTSFRDVVISVAESKVHRCWVLDDQAKPIGVITLSDIIRTFMATPFFKAEQEVVSAK